MGWDKVNYGICGAKNDDAYELVRKRRRCWRASDNDIGNDVLHALRRRGEGFGEAFRFIQARRGLLRHDPHEAAFAHAEDKRLRLG